MNYIFDTQALLWIVSDDQRLSDKAKSIYLDKENEIYFSMASVWELAIKSSLNKIDLGSNLEIFIQEHVIKNGFKILNISIESLFKVEELPFHHRDPFDRLIVSQSIMKDYQVVTSDDKFDMYLQRVW